MNRVKVVIILILLLVILINSRRLLPQKHCSKFSIKEEPFNSTLMSKQDHQALISIMARLDQLCKRENLTYFISCGSLMGAMRYQNRMPWDDDIDIGIFDTNKFKNLPFSEFGLTIRETFFGYKVYDSIHSRKVKFELNFPFVDVFVHDLSGDKYVYQSSQARKMWPREEMPIDYLFPLTKCSFAGLSLPCPAKTREFLNQAYPGWDSNAYINPTHSGSFFLRTYVLPINQATTLQVLAYLETLRH